MGERVVEPTYMLDRSGDVSEATLALLFSLFKDKSSATKHPRDRAKVSRRCGDGVGGAEMVPSFILFHFTFHPIDLAR